MKAEELRIGNLVNYEQTTHVLQSIDKWNARSYWLKHKKKAGDKKGIKILMTEELYQHSIDSIKPIPLTEEWLERFGFENYSINCDNEGYNHIDVSFHNKAITVYLNDYEISWVFHVHQLQNLFYYLCGEELKIIGNERNLENG